MIWRNARPTRHGTAAKCRRSRPHYPALFEWDLESRFAKLPQQKAVLIREQLLGLSSGASDGAVATLIVHT